MVDAFALEKLSIARQAIAECKTIPDAKLLLDQFTVMGDLAKRQKLELGVQNDIAECRIWTRRTLGKMVQEMPKNEGTKGQLAGRESSGGSRLEPPESEVPTLADMGISKAESSRLQAEAGIPDETVQDYFETARQKEEEITVSGLRRADKDLVSDKATYDGDEWHTPAEYIVAVREIIGEIELDPTTCETAQAEIQATHYLTKEDDALLHPWYGRVWMNPPYSMPKIEQFIDKMIGEFDRGNVTEAVVLVNNSSDTKWFHKLLGRFPACFTKGRVQFWHPNHKGFSTRQGQVFFYLGPDWKTTIFSDVFSQFGIAVCKYDGEQR